MDYKQQLEEIKKEQAEKLAQAKKKEQPEKPEQSLTKVEQTTIKPIQNLTKETEFTKAVEDAKISTVARASAEDNKFNEDFKQELKEAVLKSAQLEREKQELEKKNIELQQQYIQTKKEKEEQTQSENKWDNMRARRQYHYDGLKDIMDFLHIDHPMCVWLMYLFAIIASPIYLLKVLILSPLATLIGGTRAGDRPKLVKGAIYTILCVFLVAIIVVVVYLAGHHLCHWW